MSGISEPGAFSQITGILSANLDLILSASAFLFSKLNKWMDWMDWMNKWVMLVLYNYMSKWLMRFD